MEAARGFQRSQPEQGAGDEDAQKCLALWGNSGKPTWELWGK